MVGRTARLLGNDPLEPKPTEIQLFDEHIDYSNRVVFPDPVLKAFRKQRRLVS